MKLNKLNGVGFASLVLALCIMLITDPLNCPAVLLIVPPILLFIAIMIFVYRLLGHFPNAKRRSAPTKRLIYSGVLSAVPVLLLVLKSIDQLTVKDMLLTLSFALLLLFYFGRFSLGKPHV